MAVSTDIARTWARPRTVLRELYAQGQREDRAIAYLLAGCFLVFVAQWPRLARVAEEQEQEFDRLIAYEFMGWMIVWPLIFYAIAGLSWLVLRAAGARIEAWQARLALFWAMLAATPGGLLYGLMAGLNPGPGANVVGAIWLGALALFWVQGLREARAG